ncbi:MAG: hypothetical protein QM708_11860 [Propioniciclava sp.]|uniref:hypothetical protein n=1 Tax=Propioniciclava sp. TaxID=2038686 RepID=UPI0039E2340A
MSNDNVIPFPRSGEQPSAPNLADIRQWIASLRASIDDPFAPEPLKLLRKRNKKAAYTPWPSR